MLEICREYRGQLILSLAADIAQAFVGLYAIVYFQRLVDRLTGAQKFADVTPVLIGYIALTMCNHVLIYLEGYPRSILNNGAYQWAKLRATKKIARVDFLAYRDLGTGQLVQIYEATFIPGVQKPCCAVLQFGPNGACSEVRIIAILASSGNNSL